MQRVRRGKQEEEGVDWSCNVFPEVEYEQPRVQWLFNTQISLVFLQIVGDRDSRFHLCSACSFSLFSRSPLSLLFIAMAMMLQ